ncbi:MAG: DUF3347 domain-containing protein [Williamsia sp.]|nr:DUF3347 domain-containing protein [Williamsia sp.]
MKTIILICLITLAFVAYTGDKSNSKENSSDKSNLAMDTSMSSSIKGKKDYTPVHEILAAYLQIKNSLANDDPAEAAAGGDAFVKAIGKINESSMTAAQQKQWNELADDAAEMAEHIGKSSGMIAHQREHFYLLSKDVYDMVKIFKPVQTLYKDYCPMYNEGEGAIWLSETKEISNPYLGKKMHACGEVRGEIR